MVPGPPGGVRVSPARSRSGRRSSNGLRRAVAQDRFRAFYRDSEWLLGICLASEACWLLGDATAAAALYEQLDPFAGRHAIGHAEGSIGAVDRYLGLLAATLGRLDAAEQHLATAIRINEGMGAKPWAAHSRHDLADVLRRRDGPGDRARADTARSRGRGHGGALGMVALAIAGRHRCRRVPTTARRARASPIDRSERSVERASTGRSSSAPTRSGPRRQGHASPCRLLAAPGPRAARPRARQSRSSTVASAGVVDPSRLSIDGFGRCRADPRPGGDRSLSRAG